MKPTAFFLVLVAVFGLVSEAACSRDGRQPSSPTVEASPEAATTPVPTTATQPRALPGDQFPPDQARTLDDLVAQTAKLRGLEPTGQIEKRLIDRNAAATYLEDSLDEGDKAVLKLHEEVYKALGLIPEDADLVKLQISLLRALVLGFYDPDVKALFVISDLGLTSGVTRSTLVHEITHALQDQHYDLNAIDLRLRDDWDAYMAYVDLVEGDARGVERLYAAGRIGPNDGCDNSSFAVQSGSNVPTIIQRELQAPYSNGLCLIAREGSGVSNGVDSLFRDLPKSTEQVLHPEKYAIDDQPLPVAVTPLADSLGSGWTSMGSSSFGEFALQNLLLLGLKDPATVKSGADGWGGDRWALYGRDDARLVHLATAWDSEAEAREFWAAFRQSLGGRAGGQMQRESASSLSWQQAGKTLKAWITGDRVTIVMSNDAAAAETAARTLGIG